MCYLEYGRRGAGGGVCEYSGKVGLLGVQAVREPLGVSPSVEGAGGPGARGGAGEQGRVPAPGEGSVHRSSGY